MAPKPSIRPPVLALLCLVFSFGSTPSASRTLVQPLGRRHSTAKDASARNSHRMLRPMRYRFRCGSVCLGPRVMPPRAGKRLSVAAAVVPGRAKV
ncbi:hypothetical protein LY78DRAFT_661930 [Colletotrichum sublineola]|nr:hypothetical protein LY78DRAFT_661930 [Colletotrichum sublineola]